MCLDDPTDVPADVVDYLAEQLGIKESSVLKTCGEREGTRLGPWTLNHPPSASR